MDMKRSLQICFYLPLCGLLVWFLVDAAEVRCTVSEALALCAGSVIPALFPFLAVSSLLVSLDFGQWLSPCFSGLMSSLFHLPGPAGSALLLGLAAGYPVGAKTAADLYRSGLLTRAEAERLLTFCNNSNPVFLISVLGSGVFDSTRAGLWLWLIHIASALLTGLLFRGHGTGGPFQQTRPPALSPAPSFSGAFVAAVKSAAGAMLSICAFVTLFYVLSSPLARLSSPFGPLLTGALELFSLTPQLSPDQTGFLLAAGCAGWGGVSVLCQTASVLEGNGLSLRPCFFGKLTQGLLSLLLAALLSRYVLFKELNKTQEDYLKEFFRKKGNGPLFLSIFRK